MASKVKHNVPYYSQFSDVKREEFKPNGDGRACAMTCLKMALEYIRGEKALSVDDLFEEALIIQQDMLNRGMLTSKAIENGLPHDIIIFVAHNHGVLSYKEEFKSVSVDIANNKFSNSRYSESMLEKSITKLAGVLRDKGIIMVSMPPGFSTNKSVHTILLIGFEEQDGNLKGFYYHNPDDRTKGVREQFIALEDFKKTWRKQAIFFLKMDA
jgi:hypothetical protein